MMYTICSFQQSDQGLNCLPFSAVWSRSTLFSILSIVIRLSTICYSQSHQGLNYLPFSAVWSGSTLFESLSKQYYQGLHCAILSLYYLPFSAVWSRSTLFTILSSLIRVYTVRYFQQSNQGVHYLPFSLSSFIKVYTIPFSAVWLANILNRLIRVYTTCHS